MYYMRLVSNSSILIITGRRPWILFTATPVVFSHEDFSRKIRVSVMHLFIIVCHRGLAKRWLVDAYQESFMFLQISIYSSFMFTIFSLMLSLLNQHMLCNDIIMWVIFSNLGTILSCLQDQATIHAVLCFWVVVWNRMRSLHMDLQWIRSYLNEFLLKKGKHFFSLCLLYMYISTLWNNVPCNR